MTPLPSHPSRILITGGAGFIGSHLADLLLERGCHVTIVDNLSTGRRENLPAEHQRLRFIEADLADALPALQRQAGDDAAFDAIYHLAAAVGVRLIIDEPVRSIETNVEQTAAILRFAHTQGRAQNARGAPILIASSSEVYGKAAKSPFAEDDDVVYGPTTKTRWSYACSKAIDEYLALAHHRQHGLPAVVVRFFNTVGPRQVGSYGMVLPSFVSAAMAGRDLEVYGDGRQTRCFCDVRDVVRALPALLENPACRGRVFNLGSDQPISIRDLAALVIDTLGSRSQIRFIPYDEAYAAGFEDLRQRQPDLSRIREAVSFAPSIDLRRTIRDLAAAVSSPAAAADSAAARGGGR